MKSTTWVRRVSLGQDVVEDVDVMHLAVGDTDKRGDVTMQVEQRVHLHGAFVLTEPGPRKHRQTKVDGRRIQRIQALIELDAMGSSA
jgi:hypothetical protein